jgi:FkbM family methyltransferase
MVTGDDPASLPGRFGVPDALLMGFVSAIKKAVPAPIKSLLNGFLAALRRARWSLGSETRLCVVRGLDIRLGVSSETESYRARTYSDKEPETLDWLDENLRDGDVLYDIGANVGLYALYAAKRRPRCRVYAFEPAGQNFARLLSNISVNGLDNVIPCNTPLSNGASFALFFVSDLEAGSAFHQLGGENSAKRSTGPSLRQGALSASIDALVADYGLPAPTLIKIDVDGLEDRIVSGAARTLRDPALRSVLVEATRGRGDTASSVERALSSAGFKLVASGPEIQALDGSLDVNLIYSR